MNIKYYKYQGTGNDFILLDNRKNIYSDITEEQVKFLCHRRFGVGAENRQCSDRSPGVAPRTPPC